MLGHQRPTSAEPRCLWAWETHAEQLVQLSGDWEHLGAGIERSSQHCTAFSQCATSALLVTARPGSGYFQRLETQLPRQIQEPGSNYLESWGACLPTACLAFGEKHLLLRLVLGRLLLMALHGSMLPPHVLSTLQVAPQAAEVDVEILSTVSESSHGMAGQTQGATDVERESGLCLCLGVPATPDDSFLTGQSRLGIIDYHEAAKIMAALSQGGSARKAMVKRLVPKFLQPGERWYPGRLVRALPPGCYHGLPEGVVGPDEDGTASGSCIPGLLNYALVQAIGTFYSRERASVFLARMDDVLRLALLMAECPMRSLSSYAGDTQGMVPVFGLSLAGTVAKSREAHVGFLRGKKVLKDPFDWSGDHGRPRCNSDGVDEESAGRSAPLPQQMEKHRIRVGCLYAAVWPADEAQMRVVGSTFARHCDWARFFVAARRQDEPRKSWILDRAGQIVVNLAEVFPEAREDDSSFMGTSMGGAKFGGNWGSSAATKRKRWWSGNTIQKSLLTFLYAATHLSDSADVFCLLELDSAFVAENMRSYARAEGLDASEPVFLASLNLGMKHTVGGFPHTAGGLCMTAAALERLGDVLRPLPKREVVYTVVNNPDNLAPIFSHARTPGLSDDDLARLSGCGFVAGHWYDIMLGRCMHAANVTVHRGFEDELGRYYFTALGLPCREHLNAGILGLLARPGRTTQPRLERLASALCEPYGFAPELHRYAICEPAEEHAAAEYWISPFTIGFHGYKNLSLQRHAYRVLYKGASCTWMSSYRPRIAVQHG